MIGLTSEQIQSVWRIRRLLDFYRLFGMNNRGFLAGYPVNKRREVQARWIERAAWLMFTAKNKGRNDR